MDAPWESVGPLAGGARSAAKLLRVEGNRGRTDEVPAEGSFNLFCVCGNSKSAGKQTSQVPVITWECTLGVRAGVKEMFRALQSQRSGEEWPGRELVRQRREKLNGASVE